MLQLSGDEIPISVTDLIDSADNHLRVQRVRASFDLRYLRSNINGTALFALSHLPYLIISLCRDVARFAQSSEDRYDLRNESGSGERENVIFSEIEIWRYNLFYIEKYVCPNYCPQSIFPQIKHIPRMNPSIRSCL